MVGDGCFAASEGEVLELQDWLIHDGTVYCHYMFKYWEIPSGGLIKTANFAENTKLIALEKFKEGNREHGVYNRF